MANRTIVMSRVRQILRLHTQGTSKKQISELTGSSRNTVKKYLQKFIAERFTLEDIDRMGDQQLDELFGHEERSLKDERYQELQPLLPEIEKQMKRRGVTITALWKRYHQEHPQGYGLTQFYRYFREYTQRTQLVMHLEHKAGDKLFIDFAGEKLPVTDPETGETTLKEVFVAVLGCSQLTYVEAVECQKKEELVHACENAFHYFGGVPAAVVPDNMRSAVTKASRYEPVINELFADFAEHYSTVVLPARAYRPKDKSLVEGMVKIIYRTIYVAVQAKAHHSLDALNGAIRLALEELNNAPFKGRDYSRRQQFEELERATLHPLPVYRYEFKLQAIVTVMKNGHVCLSADKHYYSVPYRFIGKKVKILFTSTRVDIYYRYERIATHSRHLRRYHYTTVTDHLASAHKYLSEWTPEKFIEQARQIADIVAEYITMIIETKQHPEQAYRSCSGILSLARKVGQDRLIKACRRAYSFGVFNYPILVQILEKNLDQEDENGQGADPQPMPEHINIRGSDYYQ